MISSGQNAALPATQIVLLFGAGASAFSGRVLYRGQAERCPPVGFGPNGLFAALRTEGGIAATFPSDIQSALVDDFEAGMRLLESMPGTFHCALQRQIALHLASYKIRRQNYYMQLLEPAYMRSKAVQYSTVNYDILLDQAFASYGLQIEGDSIDSPSPQSVTLLKLHGACNILMKTKNKIYGNEVIDAPFGYHSLVNGKIGKLYLARSHAEIERWCRNSANIQFAPLIAQYVKEKSFLVRSDAFGIMQNFWSQKIANATAIFIIGVRCVPEDEHIWKPIFKSSAKLYIVNPDYTAIEKWGASRANKPVHLAKYFSDFPIIQNAVRSELDVIN